jgi:hypothetical protein
MRFETLAFEASEDLLLWLPFLAELGNVGLSVGVTLRPGERLTWAESCIGVGSALGGFRRCLKAAAGGLFAQRLAPSSRLRTKCEIEPHGGLRHPPWSPIRRNAAACEASPSEAISHDCLYHSNHIGVLSASGCGPVSSSRGGQNWAQAGGGDRQRADFLSRSWPSSDARSEQFPVQSGEESVA